MSPKRARGVRYTKSVKGGPRSSGGGTVNNGWKPPCMVVAVLIVFIVAGPVVGVLGFWIGVAAR